MSRALTRLAGRKGNLALLGVALLSIALMTVWSVPTSGYSSGWTEATGCTCHSPSPDSGVIVVLAGLPAQYEPGTTYELTASVQGGPLTSNGGFHLSADAGTFSDPGPHAQVVANELTHADSQARSWTVNWTAPPADTGTVTFTLFGNAVDGDGNAGDADRWNTATYAVPESGAIPLTPTNLEVSVPADIQSGANFTLMATLTEQDGTPIQAGVIEFYMKTAFGSLLMGNATTDANGIARLNYSHVAGEFLVDARFRGGTGHAEATTTAAIVIGGGEADGDPLLSPTSLTVSAVTLIVAGVWSCFAYILYLLRRISKEVERT